MYAYRQQGNSAQMQVPRAVPVQQKYVYGVNAASSMPKATMPIPIPQQSNVKKAGGCGCGMKARK